MERVLNSSVEKNTTLMPRRISVLMGIFNCVTTLGEAVESIKQQTYKNWELILCDDGSDDGTYMLACKFAESDPRLRVIQNAQNMGLGYTLNHCLQYATGDYIARMDGDDICAPDRFSKQVEFLNQHPEYAIVSSAMNLFDENGIYSETHVKQFPQREDVVKGSPIHHAPMMIRRQALEAVGGYSVNHWTLRVEDVDLWIKLYASGYKCYNFQEPLYSMRNDRAAFHRRKYKYRINSTVTRLKGCVSMQLNASCYFASLRPMIIGLLPDAIRHAVRKRFIASL